MAASEVAVSLAILGLHDFLSKSEDIIISKKLTDRISDSIANLQEIVKTRKNAEVKDDHNRETPEGEERLWDWARDAEQIAEELRVKLFRHRMSRLQTGQFTKVFDQVRLFSVMNRWSARKEMAEDFKVKLGMLFSKFTSSGPPAKGLPDNERTSFPSSSKVDRENTRHSVESDIIGRDGDVKCLLALLNVPNNDDICNLRVISVVGEQACGKTALVRSVFNKPKVKNHFDCRAWVRFTDLWAESDRMKKILVDILKQCPLPDQKKDLEHKQEEQLFEMLHKSLMDLRYLIVVDNLHETSLINRLLVPFVDSRKGSRVIVTTTKEVMQKFADPWTPVLRLPPKLTDRESEELLWVSIIGGGDCVHNDLKSKITILKERIARICNDSPPAISLLGGLFSAVEVSNCEALIDRLGDHPTLDDILNLSFDELPYMMKPRVLHMALFPEESEVPTRRLFRQWAAEGFLAEAAADGSIQMRSAEDSFHELESRNFIQVVQRKLDGSARSCRMPAFLHEFFCRKAIELKLLQIQYGSDSVSEKKTRGMKTVAEQRTQNEQKHVQNRATGHYGYKVQYHQSFASFDTRKLGTQARENEDLLKSPSLERHLLRVLDFEGVYKPQLPKTFGNELPNLRYLGLRWTVLDSIPESVGNLLLLETLDLKHANITKVTSAIFNAKNLRHLYLSEASFDESIRPPILSTKLETLWGLFIATAESPMIGVLNELESLKKLGVTCSARAVEAVKESVSKLARLESLRLRSRDLLGQAASLGSSSMKVPQSLSSLYLLGSFRGSLSSILDLSLVLQNLKALTLSMLRLEGDPMQDLKCVKNLTVLRLLARSFNGKNLCCQSGFPELRVLKLWMLENLENLVVEKGSMCKLEELEIRHCRNLNKVDGLEHIGSLEIVDLTGVQQKLTSSVGVPQDIVNAKELIPEKESQRETDKH